MENNEQEKNENNINLNGVDSGLAKSIKNLQNQRMIGALFNAHDNWAKENVNEFDKSDKKYLYMPGELIGWENLKTNLESVKSEFAKDGIDIDEKELEEEYNKWVKGYFLEKEIHNKEDLFILIKDSNIKEIDSETIKNEIIPEIENNGIGNIEEKRKEFVDEVIESPKENRQYIEKLTKEEQAQMLTKLYSKEEITQALYKAIDTDKTIDTNAELEEIKKLSEKRKEIIAEYKDKTKTLGEYIKLR